MPPQEFADLRFPNAARFFADALSGGGQQLGIDEDLMETGRFHHDIDESLDHR